MRFLILIFFSSICLAGAPSQAVTENLFNHIKSSPNALYSFLKEMPKGGELHYHLAGGAYPEAMLEIAQKKNYCLDIETYTVSSHFPCKGMTTKDLIKNPTHYAKVLRAWSMQDFKQGKESGHDHFFSTFYKFGKVLVDNEVFLLADVLRRAASQNILYLEIMVMPDNARSANLVKLPPLTRDYSKWMNILLHSAKFKKEIALTRLKTDMLLPKTHTYLHCKQQPQQPACKIQVRFLYHILREQPLDQFFEQALHAFEAASQSKTLVGINIVQPEDGIIALRDYDKHMEILDFFHAQYPQVNIALHAGELTHSLVSHAHLRNHIQKAITKGHAKRIGHGIDIVFEDNYEDLLKTMRHIPVEINLTSNEKILQVKGKNHPLRFYLKNKVPVVLSTDDEGVLRTNLTEQYAKAVLEHNLNYKTLKQISRNALSYSFLSGESIWQDSATSKFISNCKNLFSKRCKEWVKNSDKAQLQRQLEIKFLRFEKEKRIAGPSL
jgi:adenosine deaminase